MCLQVCHIKLSVKQTGIAAGSCLPSYSSYIGYDQTMCMFIETCMVPKILGSSRVATALYPNSVLTAAHTCAHVHEGTPM